MTPVGMATSLEAVAQRIASELNAEEKEAVLKESAGNSVPAQIDRRLLSAGTQVTAGALLTPEQKRRLRTAFLDTCRKAAKT
jgi:formylmethanofuran dehydrogenase subunit A